VNSFLSQKPEAKATQADVKETAALFRNLIHETDWDGTVTYFTDKTKKKALALERAEQVQVEDSKTRRLSKIWLRLTVQKFEMDLKVEGDRGVQDADGLGSTEDRLSGDV
jgi:hypothetical protein